MRWKSWLFLCVAAFAATLIWLDSPPRTDAESDAGEIVGPAIGNPKVLEQLYAEWKEDHVARGGDREVALGMGWVKGLSSEMTTASGQAAFDLVNGAIRVEIDGLPVGDCFDLWIVDNVDGPNRSMIPEEGDRMVRIGRLEPRGAAQELDAPIDDSLLGDFDLDLVVVARADTEPWEGGLLYGTPDLFLRLYSMEQRKARDREQREVSGMLLAMVGPPMQSDDSICADLACLVARGEKLFFGETFSGNGRTCGTCHPAENNLTIEPEFIAGLPDSDPLFIGEDRPNHPFPSLVFERPESFGLRFENPVLMRSFGLIVENLDGFASPISSAADRFTMRGVPHVFAQKLSIVAPPQAPPPAPPLPKNRTGWSGDGSPSNDPAIAGSDGTLRFFAAGAVRQHFTKNILRRVNIDFVFPTDAQLTALEAFQLTLGRQQELNLATLVLLDAQAQLGKGVFTSAVGRCNGCHGNAGANRGGTNENFNTGVERFLTNHPDGTGEQRPPDGGFGTNPQGDFTSLVANLDPTDGIFGNKQFNTPSLVEFADTLPGFHNNITAIISNTGLPNTVEGAVTFYTTNEFDQSPSGPRININATQIAQIGKFLRVINALENERSARDFAKRARNLLLPSSSLPDFAAVNRLLRVAVADCTDAIGVLGDVGLHPVARALFNEARQKLEGAMAGSIDTRVAKIDQAVVKLDAAEADMKIVP